MEHFLNLFIYFMYLGGKELIDNIWKGVACSEDLVKVILSTTLKADQSEFFTASFFSLPSSVALNASLQQWPPSSVTP